MNSQDAGGEFFGWQNEMCGLSFLNGELIASRKIVGKLAWKMFASMLRSMNVIISKKDAEVEVELLY